jgi:hypothetical protein
MQPMKTAKEKVPRHPHGFLVGQGAPYIVFSNKQINYLSRDRVTSGMGSLLELFDSPRVRKVYA